MKNTRHWGDNDKHFGPFTFAKDRYAKNGYYGFRSTKWTMLVKAEFVTYG